MLLLPLTILHIFGYIFYAWKSGPFPNVLFYRPITVCPYDWKKWMAMNWSNIANCFGFISDVNIWKWISEGLRESMVFELNIGSMGDRMMSAFLEDMVEQGDS